MKVLNGFTIECDSLRELNYFDKLFTSKGYVTEIYEEDLMMEIYGNGYLPKEIGDKLVQECVGK